MVSKWSKYISLKGSAIDPGIIQHELDLQFPDQNSKGAKIYKDLVFKRKCKKNQQDRFLNKREATQHPSLIK